MPGDKSPKSPGRDARKREVILRSTLATFAVAAATAVVAAPGARATESQGKTCPSTTSSGRLYAGPATSCAFARRIERRVNASGTNPAKIAIRSPVTGRIYTLYRTSARNSATGYRYASRVRTGLRMREVY